MTSPPAGPDATGEHTTSCQDALWALAALYDRPAPRYTSYPPATHFDDLDANTYAAHLRRGAQTAGDPVSAYIHLPFCRQRCAFCGCHVMETRDLATPHRYLDLLDREMSLVSELLGERKMVSQYHWGGGTPTFYDTEALRRLHTAFLRSFRLTDDAERSVEIDPRVTSLGHLEILAELGFNRISLGVQDLDHDVQEAIGRVQSPLQTAMLIDHARRLGIDNINVDLIYGLPRQTPETFLAAIETVASWRPNRLAVYGFAFVPWTRPNQRRLATNALPDTRRRFELFLVAERALRTAGYERVGIDHYALPEDDLIEARAEGRVDRSFMGYIVGRAPDTLGFGLSSIGDVAGAYFQNTLRLREYSDLISAGRLATSRGHVRSPDDEVRRFVIKELLCNNRVEWADVARFFPVDAPKYFAEELARIDGDTDLGCLVDVSDFGLALTEVGTLFSRNVAIVFDTYLDRVADPAEPRYSRSV